MSIYDNKYKLYGYGTAKFQSSGGTKLNDESSCVNMNETKNQKEYKDTETIDLDEHNEFITESDAINLSINMDLSQNKHMYQFHHL